MCPSAVVHRTGAHGKVPVVVRSEREIPFCDFQRAMTERAGYGYIVVISILLILGIDY